MSLVTETRYLEKPRNFITFDGVPLTNFELYCSGDKTFSAPQRNVDTITIPGRSGSLLRDKGSFSDITVEYSCWIPSNFRKNVEGLRNYMLSKAGYKRLEDTYDPDTYRMASFYGPLDVSAYYGSTFGSFTLQFQARPERFLKSGENWATYHNGTSTINNPTLFPAKPLLYMAGNVGGYIKIGNKRIMLIKDAYPIWIDTENLNAYSSNGENMNDYIHATDRQNWLQIEPGENEILISNLAYVDLLPRWWIL